MVQGTLDGNGICCATGHIDDCGVCDGDGSSCRTDVIIRIELSQDRVLSTCQDHLDERIREALLLTVECPFSSSLGSYCQ